MFPIDYSKLDKGEDLMKKDKDSDTIFMTYSSEFTRPDNDVEYYIHQVALRKDFQNCLNGLGRLPHMTTEDAIKYEKSRNEEVKMLKETCTSQQEEIQKLQ